MNAEKRTYRWLVLACSFLANGLTWGLLYSVGVLYKDWVRYFDSPASFVSLAGSLPTSIGCFCGPIYGFLVDKFGFRKCGFSGCLIMACGLITSSYANSVLALCFTFGLITGFGAGLLNLCACGIINDYFLHHRLLAEGVMGGGLSTGNFILSLLLQYLGNIYQWQGTLLIIGGISLHGCVISLLFICGDKIEKHPFNLWFDYDAKKQQKSKITSSISVRMRYTHSEEILKDEVISESSLPSNERHYKREEIGFLKRSWSLWQSPTFLMIITTDILTWLAIFVPYVHLVERGRENNLSENTAAWLSSTSGLAGIVGRPFTGIFCNYFHFHPFWAYCTIQMLLGFATLISSFWSTIQGLFTFAVLFGFLSNGYGMIKASAAVMLGKDKFVDALSWMLLVEGIGIALGPVLAGVIYDVSGSYNWSFRFSGALLIISAFVCFFKAKVEKLEGRLTQAAVSKKSAIQNEPLVL